MKVGKVYLVGGGPGDPLLLTRKGHDCLKHADVVLYDALISPTLLAEARPEANLIFVGKRFGPEPARQRRVQRRIERLMIQHARAGRCVVRLKGGDPFVFGRGGEEAEALRSHRIPFELVPGVTSALGVPAYAGIPATHRALSSSVTILTGREGGRQISRDVAAMDLKHHSGTLVILMGFNNLARIIQDLLRAGLSPDTPAAAIQWGTTPLQRTMIAPLGDLALAVRNARLGPPTLVVIGRVVSLARRLRWFEKRPLFGRTIIVTRPLDQSQAIVHELEAAGAHVLPCPTIRVVPLPMSGRIRRMLADLPEYDYVIFTSANGVRHFFSFLQGMKKDARSFRRAVTVAIGPETARAMHAAGLVADVVADQFLAEGILKKLEMRNLHGKRVLIPRALEAREILPDQLRRRGAAVDVVPLYKTVAVPHLRRRMKQLLASRTIEAVTFTSSSTVHPFFHHAPLALRTPRSRLLAACIGPITAKTVREYHKGPILVAKTHTAQGLIAALIRHYRRVKHG